MISSLQITRHHRRRSRGPRRRSRGVLSIADKTTTSRSPTHAMARFIDMSSVFAAAAAAEHLARRRSLSNSRRSPSPPSSITCSIAKRYSLLHLFMDDIGHISSGSGTGICGTDMCDRKRRSSLPAQVLLCLNSSSSSSNSGYGLSAALSRWSHEDTMSPRGSTPGSRYLTPGHSSSSSSSSSSSPAIPASTTHHHHLTPPSPPPASSLAPAHSPQTIGTQACTAHHTAPDTATRRHSRARKNAAGHAWAFDAPTSVDAAVASHGDGLQVIDIHSNSSISSEEDQHQHRHQNQHQRWQCIRSHRSSSSSSTHNSSNPIVISSSGSVPPQEEGMMAASGSRSGSSTGGSKRCCISNVHCRAGSGSDSVAAAAAAADNGESGGVGLTTDYESTFATFQFGTEDGSYRDYDLADHIQDRVRS